MGLLQITAHLAVTLPVHVQRTTVEKECTVWLAALRLLRPTPAAFRNILFRKTRSTFSGLPTIRLPAIGSRAAIVQPVAERQLILVRLTRPFPTIPIRIPALAVSALPTAAARSTATKARV